MQVQGQCDFDTLQVCRDLAVLCALFQGDRSGAPPILSSELQTRELRCTKLVSSRVIVVVGKHVEPEFRGKFTVVLICFKYWSPS